MIRGTEADGAIVARTYAGSGIEPAGRADADSADRCQREKVGKPAGARTHMLVSLGTALVVLACAGMGMQYDAQSRVIQGIVTGIGFIGAGSILKLDKEREIQGLTTAAGLWMTAAIGIACAVGTIGIAIIAAVLTVIVLALAGVIENWTEKYENVKE